MVLGKQLFTEMQAQILSIVYIIKLSFQRAFITLYLGAENYYCSAPCTALFFISLQCVHQSNSRYVPARFQHSEKVGSLQIGHQSCLSYK